MDADAKFDSLVGRDLRVALDHCPLDFSIARRSFSGGIEGRPIRAYGQRLYVPRKQVGHMAAPTSVAEALRKPLPMGGTCAGFWAPESRDASTRSASRRPKSAKARSRGEFVTTRESERGISGGAWSVSTGAGCIDRGEPGRERSPPARSQRNGTGKRRHSEE